MNHQPKTSGPYINCQRLSQTPCGVLLVRLNHIIPYVIQDRKCRESIFHLFLNFKKLTHSWWLTSSFPAKKSNIILRPNYQNSLFEDPCRGISLGFFKVIYKKKMVRPAIISFEKRFLQYLLVWTDYFAAKNLYMARLFLPGN